MSSEWRSDVPRIDVALLSEKVRTLAKQEALAECHERPILGTFLSNIGRGWNVMSFRPNMRRLVSRARFNSPLLISLKPSPRTMRNYGVVNCVAIAAVWMVGLVH